MVRFRRKTGVQLLLLMALGTPAVLARADQPADSECLEVRTQDSLRLCKGTNELGVWAAGAVSATTIFGGLNDEQVSGRGTILAGLHYGRVLAVNDGLIVQYVLDVIPAEVEFNSVLESLGPLGEPTKRGTVYGAGLNPLGFKFVLGPGRVAPFLGVAGGVVFFSERVPLPSATKLTFIGDVHAGVDVRMSNRRLVTLGCKFHHISNAGTGDTNRGLNFFVLYAGFSVFR